MRIKRLLDGQENWFLSWMHFWRVLETDFSAHKTRRVTMYPEIVLEFIELVRHQGTNES